MTISDMRIFFRLTEKRLVLESDDEMRQVLPKMLKKIIARCWLDEDFERDFRSDSRALLESYGVTLGEGVEMGFEEEDSMRPKICVYRGTGDTRENIFYLQWMLVLGDIA
ncbi:MAG: hypothetical protein ACR2N8_00200 [Parvibaculales bacterium]